ncbi:hypothetical protein E6R62_32100 [Streptomyces sp. A1136]|nr:hypothetical protein E6R62_32100 [Streptomyces sp. A1136]
MACRFRSPTVRPTTRHPAAVGDVAEFLDVDVDEVARPVVFVAADRLSGGPVQPGQAVQT